MSLLEGESPFGCELIKYHYLMCLQSASMPEDRENKKGHLSKLYCIFTVGHGPPSYHNSRYCIKGRFLEKDDWTSIIDKDIFHYISLLNFVLI